MGFSDAGDDSETGPAVLIGKCVRGADRDRRHIDEGDCILDLRGFVTSVPATPAPSTD